MTTVVTIDYMLTNYCRTIDDTDRNGSRIRLLIDIETV